jgi:hypothetical protein
MTTRTTKLKGRIKGTTARSNDGIARAILADMGSDNGCRFVPCKRHGTRLVHLVGECWAQGMFDGPDADDQISLLAYGEETEMMALVKKYPSGPALHRCLNAIFDGCRRCDSELLLR